MRVLATVFSDGWQSTRYERGKTQTFHNEFFQILGVMRHKVAKFEEHVKRLSNRQGFIDLFWKRTASTRGASFAGDNRSRHT